MNETRDAGSRERMGTYNSVHHFGRGSGIRRLFFVSVPPGRGTLLVLPDVGVVRAVEGRTEVLESTSGVLAWRREGRRRKGRRRGRGEEEERTDVP